MENGAMHYKRTTQVPNVLFDELLPTLTLAELKLLLIIIRQTNGWVNKSGERKTRDRITGNQFIEKTNLSRRIISSTLNTLISKGLVCATDYHHHLLDTPAKRKGKSFVYYSFNHVQTRASTCASTRKKPVQKGEHNKTKQTKETETKGNEKMKSIQEILDALKH